MTVLYRQYSGYVHFETCHYCIFYRLN